MNKEEARIVLDWFWACVEEGLFQETDISLALKLAKTYNLEDKLHQDIVRYQKNKEEEEMVLPSMDCD